MSGYTAWKKNSPLLYTQLQTSALLWPSLALDWLPDASAPADNHPWRQHRLLLSTYSNNVNQHESLLVTATTVVDVDSARCKDLQNFDYSQINHEFAYSLPLHTHHKNSNDLLVQTAPVTNEEGLANALVPAPVVTGENDSVSISVNDAGDNTETELSTPKVNNSLGLLQRIPHVGDINRIRHCPQNPDLIATSCETGTIRVFDRTKKPNSYETNDTGVDSNFEFSDIILDFHTSESWTIDWNPHRYATIATASNDGSIAVWDLQSQFKAPPKKKLSLQKGAYNSNSNCRLTTPDQIIPAHDYGVNEIKWIPDHDSLLMSVGEDSTCKLWDIRLPSASKLVKSFTVMETGNADALNTVDINPFQTFQFVTATAAGSVHVFDTRTTSPIYTNTTAHTDAITATKYSPHTPGTFATASNDSTVVVWTNNTSGNSPHPAFVHRGHLLPVNDVAWCPTTANTLASCANDNSVHIWQPVLNSC